MLKMKLVKCLILRSNFTVIRQYYCCAASVSTSGQQCWWNNNPSWCGTHHHHRSHQGSHVKLLGLRYSSSFAKPALPSKTEEITHVYTRRSLKDSDDQSTPSGAYYFLSSKVFKTKTGQTIPEYIVNSCPASFQPYLRLSRMDKPIGTWLLFWPCTWGLALASTIDSSLPSLTYLSLFGLGAFIMRGAGCTINDLWDRHIDAKVKRTSNRPLASGLLRRRHAVAWLASQLSISLGILCQLPEPCFLIGLGSLGLVILYPLAKRVTNWPQAVLGLTFNTGVLMGYTAIVAAKATELSYLSLPWLNPSCLSLYLAGISWTLIYDTIYAHQDREEDTLLGLGSTAKLFGANSKYWLSGFSASMLSSLSVVGYLEGLNWPYFVGLTACAAHLAWQIKTLDINNNQDCSRKFTSNRQLGWMIFLSLLAAH